MSKLQRMFDYMKINNYNAIYKENGFVTMTGNVGYRYDVENNGYEKYKNDYENLRNWLLNFQANNKNDEKYVQTIRLGNKLLRKFSKGYRDSVKYASWK